MPKRVSLKGKGADIFFGDYSPTRDQPPTDASPPDEPGVEASSPPEARPDSPPEVSEVRASARARTHARSDASTSAGVRTTMRIELHKKLQAKQRLASYTFRFRPEELDELEQVLGEIEGLVGQKPSKNDLVRLALLWLLADYRENTDVSVLIQVLARL
jgi:hypothetical protein